MDLSGKWTIKLDPEDEGLDAQWQRNALQAADGQVNLPGSLQSQGFGEAPGIHAPWTGDIRNPRWYEDPRYAKHAQPEDFEFPFWLQPEKVYVGPAWYQREIHIPADWQEKRVTLTLERAHWGTRAWLDGKALRPSQPGLDESLSVPHVYELGSAATPGAHTLTLRVDNRLLVNVGPNAHSVSDHTQTNWNGVVGSIRLDAGAPVWIEDVQVYPNVAEKSTRVLVRIANSLGQPGQARITVQACGYNEDVHIPNVNCSPAPLVRAASLEPQGSLIELVYILGADARAWDEFDPALYRMMVFVDAAVAGKTFSDERALTFGMREVSAQGTQLALNGRPIFLRGTLECSIFPLTGYPPTAVEDWERILSVARSYGLNQLRFHSYCPPEAAFQAADEMGFYYQIEIASWANQGACIGEGDPLDRWLYEEAARITRAYGNHPSFLMMAYGNEPAGDLERYLTDWVTYWKNHDTRRVYTSGAGWPALDANQYHNVPAPRIQAWGEQLNSRINALPPETMTDYRDYVRQAGKPVVSHEIGQWCVYPNFDEIAKYTGHLKAKNFEVFRESLQAHGMGDQAHDFLIASGKLQVLCYKEEIESALRTPGFAGFHLLDLHDFPGQGTALVGVLDPFWDDKGYVTGAEYSRFCNAIVPLARMSKRIWQAGETFHADVDIANFGPAPLRGVTPQWQIADAQGQMVASGQLPTQNVPVGNSTAQGDPLRLGSLDAPLEHFAAPGNLTLTVRLPGVTNLNGSPAENDWEIWVFPASADAAQSPGTDAVRVTHTLEEALPALENGEKVLLLLPPAQVKTESIIGFSSVFWNTEWTGGQAPHTLGILVDPEHPVFAGFPTESHSNWQWWELIHGAAAMHVDALPVNLRPLVQPIDTWFDNRRLALLLEARVSPGKLMVASMDLENDLARRPAARQLRRSILNYMAGGEFEPQHILTADNLRALLRAPEGAA